VRVVVALCVTALCTAVLAVVSLRGGVDQSAAPPTTAPSDAQTTVTTAATQSTTTSSIEVLADWYPKRTSRYSDRRPPVTVTTLAPTTSTTEPVSNRTSRSDGSGG